LLLRRTPRGRARIFWLKRVGFPDAQANAGAGRRDVAVAGVGLGGAAVVSAFDDPAVVRTISLFGLAHPLRIRHTA
jgi:hypothetical protein